MVKHWILIGFFCIVCSNFINAQNEQLKKEIEQYILSIDTLITHDLSDVDTLRITAFHGSIIMGRKKFLGIPYNFKNGGGGDWSYFKQNSTNANQREWGDKIFYEYIFKTRHKITKNQEYRHIKEYYRDEKVIAVKREYGKTCWFPSKDADFRTTQITFYISDNDVIYYQKTGKVSRKHKKFLEQKYDVKIH